VDGLSTESLREEMAMANEDEQYERARKRVQQLRGFYIHLLVYLIVNIGLFGLNMFTGRQYLWFVWPALGWGIGLLSHGLSVAGWRFMGREWEERKIREELDRMKREGGH
jgi:hypothetical protein